MQSENVFRFRYQIQSWGSEILENPAKHIFLSQLLDTYSENIMRSRQRPETIIGRQNFHLFTIVDSSLSLKVRPSATHINPKTNKNKYESNNRRKDQRLRPQINTLLLQNVMLNVTTFILRKFLSFPMLLEQQDYVPLFRSRHFCDWQNVHVKFLQLVILKDKARIDRHFHLNARGNALSVHSIDDIVYHSICNDRVSHPKVLGIYKNPSVSGHNVRKSTSAVDLYQIHGALARLPLALVWNSLHILNINILVRRRICNVLASPTSTADTHLKILGTYFGEDHRQKGDKALCFVSEVISVYGNILVLSTLMSFLFLQGLHECFLAFLL
uniref:Uncharacterized protein n=1 Tax=Glossina pallidipes TaxID=7398 RepID=A0A1A9ZRC1_GLOPL